MNAAQKPRWQRDRNAISSVYDLTDGDWQATIVKRRAFWEALVFAHAGPQEGREFFHATRSFKRAKTFAERTIEQEKA